VEEVAGVDLLLAPKINIVVLLAVVDDDDDDDDVEVAVALETK
jgi:hypothetical protein